MAPLLAAVFALTPNAPAAAQEPQDLNQAPVEITPAEPQEPATLEPQLLEPQLLEPQSLEPQSLEPPEPSVVEPAANDGGSRSGQPIEVDILEALDADSVGALGALDGGFGPALWQDAEMTEVAALMRGLPPQPVSPAIRDIMRRLLLSTAPPPGGQRLPGAFVTLRLQRLSDMGDFDAVSRLLAVTPGRDRDLRLAEVEAEVNLLKGAYPQACGQARIGTRDSQAVFWQRLLVLCQALAGARAEAELGLSLIGELAEPDPTFDRLLGALLAGENPVLETAPRAEPLHIAMFRLSKATIADEALAHASPAALIATAGSSHLDIASRLRTAELLADAGALPPGLLRQLFEAARFESGQLANPISAAGSFSGIEGLALLYQASRAQDVDSVRAEAISLAFQRARARGLFSATAGAFLPVVRSLPARTDLAWFAEDAAQALIMAGETAVAAGWVSILRSAAVLDGDMADALVRLTPLIHLGGLGQAPLLAREFEQWWSRLDDEPVSRVKGAVMLTLMEALQPGSTAGLWRIMGGCAGGGAGYGIDLALWHRLSETAALGAPGRPILLAAALLGSSGLQDVDPLALKHVMTEFAAIGLDREARAIALEAAVAAGL